MKNDFVKVRVKGKYYKLINKIKAIKIPIDKIEYKDEICFLTLRYKYYVKLKKYLPNYNFEIVSKQGLLLLKDLFKKYHFYMISFAIGIIFLLFLSNIMIEVNVVHSSNKIRNMVSDALEDRGIKRFSLKKDYNEIESIKKDILNKYNKDLEWIEIEVHGMKYIVRVEQRIIKEKPKVKDYCHIIANKDGVITDVLIKKGVSLITRNTYVKKGDILISGDITLNNEIKSNICADGIVKAEVWYTVNVSLPLRYPKVVKTGKKRINFAYDRGSGKNNVFHSKYNSHIDKSHRILSLFGTIFYIIVEEETKEIKKIYNEQQATEKAISLALEKVNIKKDDQDRIITQKVLKKSINNSTINLEIFFAVEEEIGKQEIMSRDGEVS